MKRVQLLVLSIIALFVFTAQRQYTLADSSQNIYYIRGGATGTNDGSDWTNAWTDLPASLERGATYYVAAGRYGPHLFNERDG